MIRTLLILFLLSGILIPQVARAADSYENKVQQHLQTMTYEYGLLDGVHKALTGDQLTLRAYAATYMGKYGTAESAALLIDALSDESVHVGANYKDAGMATTRHRAKLGLKELTGEDFGFKWDAPSEERQAAIDKWKDWLSERSIILEKVRAYLKEKKMDKYSIYRSHMNPDKTLWSAALTTDPPRPGAPVLLINRKTHKIHLIPGR